MGSRFRWGVSIALVLLLTCAVHAQIRSSTITGTVTDASGAVVPNAQVLVTDQQTGVENRTETTGAGQYTVPYLPAGTYTVAVSVTGFVPYRQTGIALTPAQTVRVDVNLKVGAVESAVEVAAQAAQIQTDSSTVQGAIQSDVIAALPNPTQNPIYYASLQAGVVPRNATADSTSLNSFGIGTSGRRQWSAIGVNGGRTWTNDIQLDGLPVMGGGYNEASVVPNTEGLQEVRVIANNFSAQYGHGQSVIAMNTRSGTNDFHGAATYRLRNEALKANTFSNNANMIARPPFKVNELGGSVGGPILRDKLFFFSSYHWVRHNRGNAILLSVPTALERQGNFSQTKIREASGAAVPAQIFDPWNVTQLGPDLFRRTPIPGAIIPNPNPAALKAYGYYPDPNRTPDDAFNTNNFQAATVTTVRRHSLNNRVDYRIGKHSVYGSFGIAYAPIKTPRPFGKAPFNDAPSESKDKNPYVQIGDTIVLSPTLVLDLRYGLSRVFTKSYSGNKSGFTDYDAFGVPTNIRPLFAIPGSAPVIQPNAYSGGSGGGSIWTSISGGLFGTKRENQSNHSFAASATKMRGSWTHKFGVEARNLLSNYSDLEESAAVIAASWFHIGGNFNFEYTSASGDVAPQNTTNAQKGVNGAAMLLGVPSWWIRPGANVLPAFSQKYFALYVQNDWRATSRLTINLGLRWDLQPGPTERYNRISAVDLTANNAFGSKGAVAFPTVGGYSRNLWETVYDNWGPRLGAAYQLDSATVLRGGFGITYLPSNSGYYSGPSAYGANSFSSGTMQQPYGPNPNGVPALRFTDPHPLNLAAGANPSAPPLYGLSSGDYRFDRFYKNGRVMQWNFFIERRFAGSWFTSIGYSAAHSSDLMNRQFPINSIQQVPQSTLDAWRTQYIASDGVTNPASVQVANPFQPASGPLLGFTGPLGGKTISQVATLYPYPLLYEMCIHTSHAKADYNSLQLRLSHAFSRGFHIDMNYTWSKELDDTDTMEDDQGFNSGGRATAPDLKNYANNRHIGFSDIPHRLSAVILYDLPFGEGQALDPQNRVVRAIAGGWQVGGTLIAQSGMPFAISGASTNAAYAHPDQIAGVPLEVPKELQRWYDGATTVTLPNGRQIKPSKNTFLKWYSGAFSGRTVTTPGGKVVPDVYWYGTVCNTLNGMRNDGRFNLDMSLRRNIRITERYNLELSAEAVNVLNHTQFSSSYSGALGDTNTVTNASNGLKPGMGTSATFGTKGNSTFDPREVILNLRFRF
ncbi:MAG: TonB-dependent receptor domain-containing protein [Bryobacteraceae bacterium]